MAMIVIVVVTALYLTLLNFKRLRELTRWIKRLVIGLFLVYGVCGLYLIVTEDSPGEVIKTFIPYFGMSLLAAGIRYISKKRRARQKNWSVDDYPIVYWKQNADLKLLLNNADALPWVAGIKGWYWMSGYGHNREEAYLDLIKRFDAYKSEGNKLPEPGTVVYPVMASQDRMVGLELEAVVFFKTIFGWDYYDLFISDKSSLYDLCLRDEFDRIQRQIEETFGIEVDDAKIKIVDILEQIRTNQPLKGE